MVTRPIETHPTELSVDQARQGETGHGVRFVLMGGLILAIFAMAAAMAFAR